MNWNGSVVQSSRRASTTSRWPISRTGLCLPDPCSRTTTFFFRSSGPITWMSLSGNPASRNRCAMTSAAAVTLPTESVELISISCLKISSASRRVAASAGDSCCACIETTNTRQETRPKHHFLDPTYNLHKKISLRKFCLTLRLKANRFIAQKPNSHGVGSSVRDLRHGICAVRLFCGCTGSHGQSAFQHCRSGDELVVRYLVADFWESIWKVRIRLHEAGELPGCGRDCVLCYSSTSSRSWRVFHSGAR